MYTPISINVVGEIVERRFGKNNEFFTWCKTAVRTANWPRLNMTVHEKFRNIAFHCPFTNAQEM